MVGNNLNRPVTPLFEIYQKKGMHFDIKQWRNELICSSPMAHRIDNNSGLAGDVFVPFK
ncbi:hypothetical protein JHK86_027987 [Glycine max]|nr:hypothetical protein JHK86_027987 [Glycine max]